MATNTPDTATTRRPTSDANGSKSTTEDGVIRTARDVAQTVAESAGDVTARIPEIAQGTRDAFAEANRMVHGGSDQTLRLVGAASIGFGMGLLVGGANRILVLASLVPAALIGATMVERMEHTAGPPNRSGVQGA